MKSNLLGDNSTMRTQAGVCLSHRSELLQSIGLISANYCSQTLILKGSCKKGSRAFVLQIVNILSSVSI